MAFIKFKDYLESLTTKGSTSNSDVLPLLDSDAGNVVKTIAKGTLVDLNSISGFTEFSQSVESSFANTSQFSESLDDTFAKDTEVQTTASLINGSITSLTNNVSTTASFFDSTITQVSLNLSNYQSDNNSVVRNIQAYTSSLKGAITVSGDDVSIKGTLTTTNFFAQYVTSSFLITTGSNVFGDNSSVDKHEFTGSVHFADTIYLQGEPIGITALNAFSASVNNSIIQIGNHTSSVDNSVTLFGAHTASQTTINSGISAVTGAFATELGEIQTTLSGHRGELNGLESYTASQDTTNTSVANSITLFGAHTASQTTINSGILAVTGAFATELGEIQTTLTGHRNELNGIEAWTASLDDTYATDAQLYRLYQATRSLELHSGSVDNSIVQIGNHTASVDNSITLFGAHTASQTTINSGISAVTGAFATELGEIQTQLTNRRGELNGLESYTSSLKSVSIVSGSSQIDVTQTTNYGSINQYTDSDNLSYINSINVISSSADSGLNIIGNITGSSARFTGSLSVGTNNLNARIFRVYGSGDIAQFTSTNPGVGGAQIDITHESATPADGDNVGIINFGGFDTGLNATQYANIKAIASSVSSEIGELHFGTRQDSTTYNGSNMILDGNGAVSASVFHISETAKLVSQNPLPTGVAGMLAVSASGAEEKLYFHNGTIWRELSFV